MILSGSLVFSSSVTQFSGLLNKKDTRNRSCFEASLKGEHPNTIKFFLLMSTEQYFQKDS